VHRRWSTRWTGSSPVTEDVLASSCPTGLRPGDIPDAHPASPDCDTLHVLDHVTIRVGDREASRRFYDTVLAPLGYARTHSGAEFDEWRDFGIAEARPDRPLTQRLHVGFVTRSRAEVDAFWETGTAAGYPSDGEPGPRPEYHADYYGGFLLDPDGNSAEAVYHGRVRAGDALVDHLWIRVADLSASRRFYETIAPTLALELRSTRPEERFHVVGDDRSFALVRGESPTAHVHLAFPAPDDATVDAFHRTALDAGFRDNGAPGLRPHGPGYYGAYVLDPDGNNIEAVNHHR
jgi:catechol 2,3-dioxygenase-like lactoylglutathione lyase family enzyme